MRALRPPAPDRRAALSAISIVALLSLLPMTESLADTGLPPEIRAALPQARLLGQAGLKFFGLNVYEARLWVPPGFEPARYDEQPFALELTYARRLEGEAIAERSIAEMRRIGTVSDEQARRWLDLMTQAFPDVVANDRLLGLYDGQGEVRFFHNGQPTARIADPDYARLFFGIWLAPQTSAPAMRTALLGGQTR